MVIDKTKTMKKILIALILALTFGSVFSQDFIIMKSGDNIQSKILEVTTTEIKYKKFDNQTGPIYSVLKSDVQMIIYENGTKDIFKESNSSKQTDLCMQGQKDSKQNYIGKKSGAGWTCAATICISPLIGLIPAAICASSEPLDENLNVTNTELMKDANYNRCYKEQAHKTKKRKIWTNYGIGSGVWLLIAIIPVL